MSAKFKLALVSQTSQASSQTLVTAACKFTRANTKEAQAVQTAMEIMCFVGYDGVKRSKGGERENICIRQLKREGCG